LPDKPLLWMSLILVLRKKMLISFILKLPTQRVKGQNAETTHQIFDSILPPSLQSTGRLLI
jgi:hypothetical protein